ncbi:Cytochrome P450 3A4 [Desmophyllum pertusum]|uniref:Cytochrome P450 3A4 n=1 Tax=Desmophyllum pertusum TaxID=174260 RepID=A0A9X0A192_9CNID|nr:Cytochrome P450 3A4 [Desmophyllum pertusum]
MADFPQTIAQFANDHWVTLLVGFLILLFYRYCVEPFTVFKKLGICGPTPLPFVGNTARTLFDPNILPKLQQEWYMKYGKVYGYNFPSSMIRRSIIEIPKPYNKMLSVVPGQKWRDLRNTLSPTFSASKMKQVATEPYHGSNFVNSIWNQGEKHKLLKMIQLLN